MYSEPNHYQPLVMIRKLLENYDCNKLVILFLNKLLIMYKLQQPNWPWIYITLCKSYLY